MRASAASIANDVPAARSAASCAAASLRALRRAIDGLQASARRSTRAAAVAREQRRTPACAHHPNLCRASFAPAPSAISFASAISRRIGAMPQLVVATMLLFGTNFDDRLDHLDDILRGLDGVAGDVDHAGLHDLALEQAEQFQRHLANCGIRSRPAGSGSWRSPGRYPRTAATRCRASPSSRCWP